MTDEQKRLINTIRSSSTKGTLIICAYLLFPMVGIFLLSHERLVLEVGTALLAFAVIYGITYSKKSTDVIKNNGAMECVIEDYLIIKYGSRYMLSPILKNIVTNELYYTFDKYDLSLIIKAYAKKPDALSEMKIMRIDKTEVQIGDRALIYIKRYIDPKLHIEPNDDHYYIDGENVPFRNMNPKYDISVMNDVKFFEGVIDIE